MSEAEPGPVAAKNTDTHLWPQVSEDAYAPRLFATVGDGIGIDVGGHVIVKPIRDWHALAQGWQPIGTAPKDWRNVLIAGRYQNGTWYVEESYRHAEGHYNARKLEPPTHWMPLPAPPSRVQAVGE